MRSRLLVLIVFNVAITIISGFAFVSDCPLQPNIPIFLIVSGISMIVLFTTALLLALCEVIEEECCTHIKYSLVVSCTVLLLFDISWQVVGKWTKQMFTLLCNNCIHKEIMTLKITLKNFVTLKDTEITLKNIYNGNHSDYHIEICSLVVQGHWNHTEKL